MRFCMKRRQLPSMYPPLLKLGMGTIWFGLPWPPGCRHWIPPGQEEINRLLGLVIDATAEDGSAVLVDTAAAYRESETRLGRAVRKLSSKQRKHIAIATNFGEFYDESAGTNKTDFSTSRCKSHCIEALSYSVICTWCTSTLHRNLQRNKL